MRYTHLGWITLEIVDQFFIREAATLFLGPLSIVRRRRGRLLWQSPRRREIGLTKSTIIMGGEKRSAGREEKFKSLSAVYLGEIWIKLRVCLWIWFYLYHMSPFLHCTCLQILISSMVFIMMLISWLTGSSQIFAVFQQPSEKNVLQLGIVGNA